MVVFVASHVVLSSLPIRNRLTVAMGERGFRAGYSVIAIALLAWVVVAYNARQQGEVTQADRRRPELHDPRGPTGWPGSAPRAARRTPRSTWTPRESEGE